MAAKNIFLPKKRLQEPSNGQKERAPKSPFPTNCIPRNGQPVGVTITLLAVFAY